MKEFRIIYNPYKNKIKFKNSLDSITWDDLDDGSIFVQYEQLDCIFENCIDDILDSIITYIQTSGELLLSFIGTQEDYQILLDSIRRCPKDKAKLIKCEHSKVIMSPVDVLSVITKSYIKIKDEFHDYIEYNEACDNAGRIIGECITKFNDTVNPDVNICIIGNYSVGKSALVNSLIGHEILPSHDNATTAQNIRIKNDNEFSICFDFQGDKYKILVNEGRYTVVCDNNTEDSNLISELLNGITETMSNEEMIYHIVDNINIKSTTSSSIALIKDTIVISIPFVNSSLNLRKYPFVFIDTPGSNNGDATQQAHRNNLEKVLEDQTNALPIIVVERRNLTSTDSFSLRELLHRNSYGFAEQNCIIIISKSDELVPGQMKEDLPEKIHQTEAHPTIMFVSPVIAIGEKKGNKKLEKAAWINTDYYDLFRFNCEKLLFSNPPQYNETPCGRNLTKEQISSLSPLLYASGVPSLEYEINYFAERYSKYKKCTNGCNLLMQAIKDAKIKLAKAKSALETEKYQKEVELKQTHKKIMSELNVIRRISVAPAVNEARSACQKAVSGYCDSVYSTTTYIWNYLVKDESKPIEELEKKLCEDCQRKLYDIQAEPIKVFLVQRFNEYIADYVSALRNIIYAESDKLSSSAKDNFDEIFTGVYSKPVLNDVPTSKLKLIVKRLKDHISKVFLKKESWLSNKAKAFCDVIQGNNKTVGLFYQQCIQEPANTYGDQIAKWRKEYLDIIDSTLNKDNALLSSLDQKIEQDQAEIVDMERRLANIEAANTALREVKKQMNCEE